MRKLFLFLIVAFAFTQTKAQYIHKIKADSVLITNDSCTAELNLENSTKHIKGFLYNRGNGRTEFRKAVKLNDSTFVFGGDTLLLGGSGKNFANADLTLTGNRRHTIGDDTLNLNAIVGGDTTQYTQSAKQISITGNLAGLNWGSLLNVNATGWKQDAIAANAYGGTAVIGRNLSWGGTAIGGYSNGIGVYATSGDVSAGIGMLNGHGLIAGYYGPNAHGAGLGVYRSSTEGINTVRPMIRMLNNPQLYAGNAVGIGSSIRWEFPSYTNNASTTGYFHGTAELYVKMTNLRGATSTSEMGFNAMGDSTIRTIMTLDGHGNISLPNYSGTNWQVSDTAGYKALVVDNSGNVRKSNSFPGGGGSGTAWSLTGNAGTNPTSNFIGTTDNQDVALRTNNIERVRVATTGKVGIGTTNPQYKLDLRNSTDSTWAMIHMSRDSTDTGGYIGISKPSVLLLSSDASPNSYNSGWVAKSASAAMMSIASGGSANPNVGFFLNTGLTPGQVFGPLSIMQMNGGDAFGSMRGVGLGTPVSWHRLHVSHSDSNLVGLENTGALSATSGSILRMYNRGTPSAADQRLGAVAWGTGASITGMRTGARIQAFSESAWTDNASQPTYLNFETAPVNANAPVERMRITSSGNVGVGTATPAYKLDVNGKLGVRTIDSTATAANVLYQDPATGEIKKAGKQSFAQTATTTIAGTDDETTLVSSGAGSLTIPASAWFAGKSFRITIRGVYSTSVEDPAGITIKIKLGSTVIAQSASMLLGSGRNNLSYEIRADLTCRATGASGSLFTMGMFYNDDDMHSKIENIATTINLSGSQTLDITAKLSDESAGNAISAFILTFEAIN
jgi:hypothetical protein